MNRFMRNVGNKTTVLANTQYRIVVHGTIILGEKDKILISYLIDVFKTIFIQRMVLWQDQGKGILENRLHIQTFGHP